MIQRGRKRRIVVPRGSLADGEAPFDALAHLDAGRHGWRHLAAVLIALGAHGLFGAAATLEHETGAHPPPRASHRQIQATLQRAPPPPLPAPPPRRVPEARAGRTSRRNEPPPAPAQAARVIARAPESGPADLTGFDLVMGEAKQYAGGYSSSKGTSTKPIEDPGARIGGVPDAQRDLSRAAAPLRRDWGCSWPDEAQDTDLRDARVTVRVSVGSDGAPSKIEILSAPPGGFAEAARRCAEREEYRPALDVNGKPLPGATNLFNVHFLR